MEVRRSYQTSTSARDMLVPTSERNGEMKEGRGSNRRKEGKRKGNRQGQRGEGRITGQ